MATKVAFAETRTGRSGPQKRIIAITQLILHIGDPKTGTSSIQTAMKEGLIHCETRDLSHWKPANAIPLAHVMRNKKAASQRYARYAEVGDWLRNCKADYAIISSENFSEVDPDLLYEMLEKHCLDHLAEMRVIAYVRPHVSRILAAYTQRIKTGQFAGDLEKFKGQLGKTLTIDYTPKFLRWRARFGDRFILSPYIREELRDQDVVRDFFAKILGEAPFTIAETDEVNVGVTLRALSGLRVMQRQIKKADNKKISSRRIGQTIANVHLAKGPLSGEKPRIDRATMQDLIDLCSADAQALDAAFFDRPLMQEALHKSLVQAGDAPIDLQPSLYFTPKERKDLNALGKRLADLLQANHEIWMAVDMGHRGQLALNNKQRKELANKQPQVDEIDQHLSDIAEILRG